MSVVPVDYELTALDVVYALVLENGKTWGEAAADFQLEDAEAIFDETGPLWHYLTRPRGGSKTSDTAGFCLGWLAAEAKANQRGYVVAISEEQATELTDAAAGFVGRTPILSDYIGVEARTLYGANGATVRVLTSDGSSAFGKGRDTGLIVLDEFAQWPETRKMHRLWVAMISATQKTPGLKMIILTSAGEPGHPSYDVLKTAKSDPEHWRVSETPGPVPWVSQSALEGQRKLLSDSEFARLHLNQWTEDEDRLLNEIDWEAAAVLKQRDMPLPYDKRNRYIITCDIGVKVDPTVVVVAHSERLEGSHSKRVVIDSLERWVPRRGKEVNLSRIEKYLYETSIEYGNAPIYGDPSQFIQMRQELAQMGRKVREFKFTPTSVGELGSAMVMALQNRQVWLPDREELRDELLNVRLKESSPGVYRLDHDDKRHDDQAVAIGMAIHTFLGGKQLSARAWVEGSRKRQTNLAETAKHQADPAETSKRQAEAVVGKFLRSRVSGRAERLHEREMDRCDHRWRPDAPHACAFGCGAYLEERG